MSRKPNPKVILPLLLCVLAIGLFGQAGVIKAKAWVAQQLLQNAWAETLEEGDFKRPWASADTWPMARLKVDRLAIDQIVLAGASGRNLAFGPAYLFASNPPGSGGHTVISGHRDTHFSFLEELTQGDRLVLTDRQGWDHHYAVLEMEVIDENEREVILEEGDQLSLITCYPFDTPVPGGSLRYRVRAGAVRM